MSEEEVKTRAGACQTQPLLQTEEASCAGRSHFAINVVFSSFLSSSHVRASKRSLPLLLLLRPCLSLQASKPSCGIARHTITGLRGNGPIRLSVRIPFRRYQAQRIYPRGSPTLAVQTYKLRTHGFSRCQKAICFPFLTYSDVWLMDGSPDRKVCTRVMQVCASTWPLLAYHAQQGDFKLSSRPFE